MYAPNPSVKCSCNLQETLLSAGRNYTPNMAHALITSTHVCLQNHHSATIAFIRSLHPLPFCCSKELYNRQVLGAHTSHTPSSSQVRSTTHDLTRSIQLYSRSNRFIMFTFHANVPKHHVTVAEYEQPKKYSHTQVNYEF